MKGFFCIFLTVKINYLLSYFFALKIIIKLFPVRLVGKYQIQKIYCIFTD